MPCVGLTCTVLVGLLGVACLPACTSISWRDDAGLTHHLGLVWGRVDRLARGARIVRHAIGLDLRLVGVDRGYSFGWKGLDLVAPARHLVAPDDLGDSVLRALQQQPEHDRVLQGSWSFLYFTEPVSADATHAVGWGAGLDLRIGPLSPGFTLGWQDSAMLTGDALDDDIVHVYVVEHGVPSAILWRMRESNAVAMRSEESAR